MRQAYTEYFESLERMFDDSCFRCILHFDSPDSEHGETTMRQIDEWFSLNIAETYVTFNAEGNGFVIECWCDVESALKIWRRWYPGLPFMPYNLDVTDPRRSSD